MGVDIVLGGREAHLPIRLVWEGEVLSWGGLRFIFLS